MSKRILIVYKSVTGFTKDYAEMLAREMDCTLLDFKHATATAMSDFDLIIFGGRMHAGTVDGLQKVKELFKQSGAPCFLVYATGAVPVSEKVMIDEMWQNNLSPDELEKIPHFYMPGGLRYERMPLPDKLMMKMFSKMMKTKKDKSEYELKFAEAISGSYDISSREYLAPLLDALK